MSTCLKDSTDDSQLTELEYQQVCRLHLVMSENVHIAGRPGCNFPTLTISMQSLVQTVRNRLAGRGVPVKDVRLNGGAASYVLQDTATNPEYNDLDLIFRVDLGVTENGSDTVKEAVLDALQDVLSNQDKEVPHFCAGILEDAYVRKMIKICNDTDRWSLMSLTNASGHHVELKFVDRMRRQFEFSVDSFQIILDNLLAFYAKEERQMTKCKYPRVLVQSVYGHFELAAKHLNGRLIATKNPEQIRGGGLLKYCYLLARGYERDPSLDFASLEKYMCSRFFIDFPNTRQQQHKLENYLKDHFSHGQNDNEKKRKFLSTLYTVVQDSTVCLMGQERRQTLELIAFLARQTAIATQRTNADASYHLSATGQWYDPHDKKLLQSMVLNEGQLKYSTVPSVLVSLNSVPFICYSPHFPYS